MPNDCVRLDRELAYGQVERRQLMAQRLAAIVATPDAPGYVVECFYLEETFLINELNRKRVNPITMNLERCEGTVHRCSTCSYVYRDGRRVYRGRPPVFSAVGRYLRAFINLFFDKK